MIDLTPELLAKLQSIANKSNQRAIIKSIPGKIAASFLIATLIDQRGCCYYCAEHLRVDTVTVEHKIPMSLNGVNHGSNIALACFSCNNKQNTIYMRLPTRLKEVKRQVAAEVAELKKHQQELLRLKSEQKNIVDFLTPIKKKV